MCNLNVAAFLVLLFLPVSAFSIPLTKEQAVSRAQEFLLENGYTNAPPDKIKSKLDLESIEWSNAREQILKGRFNTLKPRAIGIRGGARGAQGWSVAFDYVELPTHKRRAVCRVVTMRLDGSSIRLEHQDGVREAFRGF